VAPTDPVDATSDTSDIRGGTVTRTIFTQANLLDGEHAAQPHSTVVVDGQRIVEVTTGDVTPQPGDAVYDLAGRTLMPGMIICHYHGQFHDRFDIERLSEINVSAERPPGYLMLVHLRSAQNLLASGWTAFVSGACAFNQDVELKMAIDEGIVVGPRVVPASPHMDTTGNAQDGVSWWRRPANTGVELFSDGPEEFRKAIRLQVKRGVQMIKIFATGGPGSRRAFEPRQIAPDELAMAIETAHDLGVKIRAHCCYEAEMIECIEAGIDVIDHGSDMNEKIADMMAERGVFWVPTMHFLKTLIDNPPSMMSVDVLRESWEQDCRSVAMANERGVKILPGDDYGVNPIPHVPGIYGKGVELFVEAGLTPLEAIRAATRNGAELFGLPGEIGTIEVGAYADLSVVDGDPSIDIDLLGDPLKTMPAVMKDGVFFKNELVSNADGGPR
jgi:imidazolonepropionase-like amidohydrolase